MNSVRGDPGTQLKRSGEIVNGMSQTAINRLQDAIEAIEQASDEADRDIAQTELERLRVSAEDCLCGLLSDELNSATYSEQQQ